MAKHFLKSTGTRDELSITLFLQSEINFCSVRMPVNIAMPHLHCYCCVLVQLLDYNLCLYYIQNWH